MADDRIKSTRAGRCQDHLSRQSIKAERLPAKTAWKWEHPPWSEEAHSNEECTIYSSVNI